MKNTYFHLLWQHNKCLFAFIVFFVIGQLFFSFKGVETTPFFNYGMYSEVCPKASAYKTIGLYKNGQRLSVYELSKAPSFIAYQLNTFDDLIEKDSLDPVQLTIEKRFGEDTWLSNYLIPKLCVSKAKIQDFSSWLEMKLNKKDISILRENYEWVKGEYTLVNKKEIN